MDLFAWFPGIKDVKQTQVSGQWVVPLNTVISRPKV